MSTIRTRWVRAIAVAAPLILAAGLVRAGAPLPPWIDTGEPPPPSWARSVVPARGEHEKPRSLELFSDASRTSSRRGVTAAGAPLPFFGARRGSGCSGRWWLVGPLAWTCSDDAELSAVEASAPDSSAGADRSPVKYFFVGHDGAKGYERLDSAEEGNADQELEVGWGLAVVEQRASHGESWARTTKGLWVASRELAPARPSSFHGETIAEGHLDIAWVLTERARVWATPSVKDKPKDTRARFQLVHVSDKSGPMVQVEEGRWMLASDVARPSVAPPPPEVSRPGERWVDVEIATQTLVAYEGTRPTYATLVSTGRGPAGAPSATPVGVHRVWIKLLASDMDNVERDDLEAHYSLQDVPYVQFFDDAVALHGTYWHGDFGHPRSHGCVNLAPLDARWLFGFTEPRLPAGWVAAYPTPVDPGTVVRVR